MEEKEKRERKKKRRAESDGRYRRDATDPKGDMVLV